MYCSYYGCQVWDWSIQYHLQCGGLRSIHGTIWKNHQYVSFSITAWHKNQTLLSSETLQTCYRSNTNSKFTSSKKVWYSQIISNPSSHARLCCLVFFAVLPRHEQFSCTWLAVRSTKVTCSWSAQLLNVIKNIKKLLHKAYQLHKSFTGIWQQYNHRAQHRQSWYIAHIWCLCPLLLVIWESLSCIYVQIKCHALIAQSKTPFSPEFS